uniref:Uncharacterized protein n=1 Tax=Anopheles atroparvus TaxID=41427 RepID=A0A182J3P1_ANOAO
MNWMIQKFYQNQLQLLQHLQQYQQTFAGNVAPPSPPGSSIADDQQRLATEVPAEQPQASSDEKVEDHHQEPVVLQENFIQMSPEKEWVALNRLGEASLEHASPSAAGPVKAAQGPTATKLRFHPYEFRKRQHGANIDALNLTGPVEVDLKYHKNMARSFGSSKEDSTPEQQKRRIRNTEAARISRAKARAISGLLEKESTEAAETNLQRKVLVAQKRVYIAGLLKLLGMPAKDLMVEWEQQEQTDDDQDPEGNEWAEGKRTPVHEAPMEC